MRFLRCKRTGGREGEYLEGCEGGQELQGEEAEQLQGRTKEETLAGKKQLHDKHKSQHEETVRRGIGAGVQSKSGNAPRSGRVGTTRFGSNGKRGMSRGGKTVRDGPNISVKPVLLYYRGNTLRSLRLQV